MDKGFGPGGVRFRGVPLYTLGNIGTIILILVTSA